MNIDDVNPDDLIGVVKHRSKWYIFAGTVAEWIMNYAEYDPWFDQSKSDVVFRNNILVVDNKNADAFLDAMEPYSLSEEDMILMITRDGKGNWPLVVMVDFDDNMYVNGFRDINLHKYIPSGWTGVEADPLDYVPESIKYIWEREDSVDKE